MTTIATYDVYLLLEPLREGWQALCTGLPLWENEHRFLVGARGYYDRKAGSLAIALRFRAELAQTIGTRGIQALVQTCRLPMVFPGELIEEDRQRFFGHLAQYPVQVEAFTAEGDDSPLVERIMISMAEFQATPPPAEECVAEGSKPLTPMPRPKTLGDAIIAAAANDDAEVLFDGTPSRPVRRRALTAVLDDLAAEELDPDDLEEFEEEYIEVEYDDITGMRDPRFETIPPA